MSQGIIRFGKYFLLERVASGGMAEVYLAKSAGAEGVNKIVAIKRILPQFSDHQEFIDMFKEEAKIAVNLNHGNVVSIFDFGVEKGQFFIVMEFVEGKNLRQVLNELKKKNIILSIDQIVYIAKEVAAGLDHAHRCIDGATGKPLNITHRDMSPQNIMINYEGEVKIIDFGIAKAETQIEATRAGTLKGKFGYMSPEQAEGQTVDLRTDIFSLGIVLWELLANDRLFAGSNEAAILRKIRDCNIPNIRKINPNVSPDLEKIVVKALAKDRNIRYQSAAQVHRDLNRFLNTEYPEFSKSDFSAFIKDTFSDSFLDQKRKVVEYAKLIVNEDMVEFAPNKNDENDNEQLMIDADQKTKVDLVALKAQSQKKQIPQGTLGHDLKSQTYTRSQNTGRSGRSKKQSTPYALYGLFVLVSSFVVYLTITLISRPQPQKIEQSSTNGRATSDSQQQPMTAPPPSHSESQIFDKEVAISIFSEPMGAQVIIDGVDTKTATPTRALVKLNKSFQLKLHKDGYYDRVEDITPTSDSLTVTKDLQKMLEVSYLSVDVLNPTLNRLVVKVNGHKLSETIPIKDYVVPPDTPIHVEVYDPLLPSQKSEKTVTIRKNERQKVILILGK